jgi:hypothetical protein
MWGLFQVAARKVARWSCIAIKRRIWNPTKDDVGMSRKLRFVVLAIGLILSDPSFAQSFAVDISTQTKPQIFEPDHYVKVAWPHAQRNAGEAFCDDRWMPVPFGGNARTIDLKGQLWILKALPLKRGLAPTYVARLVKNGDLNQSVGARIGSIGTHRDTVTISLDFQDLANPGDTYQIWLYVTSTEAVIDANPLHSWWSGQ